MRYYKEYPKKSFGAWSYGRKEIIQTAENLKGIDTYSFMGMGRQDIFVLFYTKYDPEKWQKPSILIDTDLIVSIKLRIKDSP